MKRLAVACALLLGCMAAGGANLPPVNFSEAGWLNTGIDATRKRLDGM